MISPSSFTLDETECRVHQALEKLREHDSHLLDVNANERSVTHHLAVYLHREFESWDVDVEYNREGHDLKRLRDLPDVKRDNVFPDVIVHIRGTNDKNLLVVEVKMQGNEDESDENKLVEFTKPLTRNGLGYRWGLQLTLDCGAECGDSLRWYEDGHEEQKVEVL